MKPLRGEIHNWHKIHFKDGYCIYGTPKGHLIFQHWVRTSKVLHHDEVTGMVETVNSRYQLVGGEIEQNKTAKQRPR